MIEPTPQSTEASRPAAAVLARVPTGAKVLLILSCALLPLALIAFFASLQTTRTADMEVRAQLRVALAESSRALAIELVGDMTALRLAANALDADPANAAACARAQGVFAQQFASGTRFAILDERQQLLCGAPLGIEAPALRAAKPDAIGVAIVDGGLVLSINSTAGRITSVAFFPTPFLNMIGRPSGFTPDHASELQLGDRSLPLTTLDGLGRLARVETQRAPIGIDALELVMTMRGAPITSPLIVAMLLPLLMWVAAAGIAWFVVDRLLIRPLRRLRRSVGAYAPGTELAPVDYGAVPAQEIQQLGDTFQDLARTVQVHEADLAEGLVRQTKLTREVHHRVKNNLQVIASLINFHARSAETPEAARAYASIQRRVDALAVVHRYHFAEMEENRGVELRSILGELASNIRATSPDPAGMAIVLEVEPYLATQDVAVAVAFLITDLIELAMSVSPQTAVRLSLRAGEHAHQAVLRVSSPALLQSAELEHLLASRYGRVIAGLARQLRGQLHHEPLTGAYEIAIAVTDRN